MEIMVQSRNLGWFHIKEKSPEERIITSHFKLRFRENQVWHLLDIYGRYLFIFELADSQLHEMKRIINISCLQN